MLMDFFKLKKFRNSHKPNPNDVGRDQPMPEPEEPNNDLSGKSAAADSNNPDMEDDDDDDFITNEVKRRLKELRRNSFMVLIPEEASIADEEEEDDEEVEGETSSSEWRDVEAEGRQFWSGFDAVYDIYCDRMLFFDRSISQHLQQVYSHVPSAPSPKPASKRLTSPLACLSLRRFEPHEEDIEHLQQRVNDPHHDLETAYVAQLCLTWEALHCQYTQLTQKISSQPDSTASYNQSAQQFQQFHVLLQRFIENEPFEHGSRPEIFARTRRSLPKLLQVPKIQASDERPTGGEEAFNPKKAVKLKELWKRSKWYKKRSWASTEQDVEMLLGLIDVKVVSRALQMVRISKEELFWCEEKMKKLVLSNGKLQRDPSPILFPC